MNPRILTIAAAAVLGWCAIAVAQTNIGTFKMWQASVANNAGGKSCFIYSEPQDSKYSQKPGGRDDVFFIVNSEPAAGIRNEASTIVGYPFAPNTVVTVDVDGKKFEMFTDEKQPDGDTAWAVAEQEAALIEAMKAGSNMTVQGQSRRGTIVTDTYSLSGVSAALAKIASECP